ncbi:MAG TPA: hypothetical protein VM492_11885 [Sumerlaeia bacterium]|nr:hypothetical protein [Sumerlaeia bacterium]
MLPSPDSCLVFLGTALLSAILTGAAVWAARRFGFLARPVERSSHSVPTPQVGGVGICLAFLAMLAFFPETVGQDGAPAESGASLPFHSIREALVLMVAVGMALGLVDDVRHLGAFKKLAGLALLAAVPLLFGVSLAVAAAPGAGGASFGRWLGGVLAFAWALFFINAYNFMDGVNGQSGAFALNALVWWVVLAAIGGRDPAQSQEFARGMQTLHLALAGAVAGFLPWNFPRAATFMGDSGSLPLGALLATLAVAGGAKGLDAFIAYCLPLSMFVYDVLYTLIRRVRRRENLFAAHRSHLYQRLLIATGWSHARLLAFHVPFYLLTGVASVLYGVTPGRTGRPLVLAAVALLLGVYTLVVLWMERRGKEEMEHG